MVHCRRVASIDIEAAKGHFLSIISLCAWLLNSLLAKEVLRWQDKRGMVRRRRTPSIHFRFRRALRVLDLLGRCWRRRSHGSAANRWRRGVSGRCRHMTTKASEHGINVTGRQARSG